MSAEATLKELALVLPAPRILKPGARLPFAAVRVRGNRAYIAGHGPLNPDGTIAGPFGKVGADVSVEEGYQAARLTALSILGSLRQGLGDLDRVTAWLRVLGMINADPRFTETASVINGFSDLILELYGPDIGRHSRSAVGVATLPHGMCVEIEAEVEIEV